MYPQNYTSSHATRQKALLVVFHRKDRAENSLVTGVVFRNLIDMLNITETCYSRVCM
jgi:hypothetical protein